MQKLVHCTLALTIAITALHSQAPCTITSDKTICLNETLAISFSTELIYDDLNVIALTQSSAGNIPATINNITDNAADILFQESGVGQIIIQYKLDGQFIGTCVRTIYILDEAGIIGLGRLSDFSDDITSCGAFLRTFDMIVDCQDCLVEWIHDDAIDVVTSSVGIGDAQYIRASISASTVGSYTLCQRILTADLQCYAEDCIDISVVQIIDTPSILIDDLSDEVCLGSTMELTATSAAIGSIDYHWAVHYDSLTWNYYSNDIQFTFDHPGTYEISLEYWLSADKQCVSADTSIFVTVNELPLAQLSCSASPCDLDTIHYRSPYVCPDGQWIYDESLAVAVSQSDSSISIIWSDVSSYISTNISYQSIVCNDICLPIQESIELYPKVLAIVGEEQTCTNGSLSYQVEDIPNALYDWQIEVTDNISGDPPILSFNNSPEASVEIGSFIGAYAISVSVTTPRKSCTIDGTKTVQKYALVHDLAACLSGEITASISPALDEEVAWTLTNQDSSYLAILNAIGSSGVVFSSFVGSGNYQLNASVPALGFFCNAPQTVQILAAETVDILGETSICPGEEYTYGLSNIAAGDDILWSITQGGIVTTSDSSFIDIIWLPEIQPYLVSVTKNTTTSGLLCGPVTSQLEVNPIDISSHQISGPDTVCYDAVSQYTSSLPGAFEWQITPEYMGSIVTGQNTSEITVQWHYAPNIQSATLSISGEVCGEFSDATFDVYFSPFIPLIELPDTICQNTNIPISVSNLSTYDVIEYYIDGKLERSNTLTYNHFFNEGGLNHVRVIIINPNGCPGLVDTAYQIFVQAAPDFVLDPSGPVRQCPKDDYQDVVLTPDLQDASLYYEWSLDGIIIDEGFGDENLYSQIITQEIIDNNTNLSLTISNAAGCTLTRSVPLVYECSPVITCVCDEDIVGQLEYVTPIYCNLISFGGSLDFGTVLSAEWRINQGDTLTKIPIQTEGDLTQDSIYLSEGLTVGDVVLAVVCKGNNISSDGDTIPADCPFVLDALDFPLFYPQADLEVACDGASTFDISITERRLPTSIPQDQYVVDWVINSISYTGYEVALSDVEQNTELTITITQTSIDGNYSCSNDTIILVPASFDPAIILPEGSCENDLWVFSLDAEVNEVATVIWDFGDGSGSTLFTTEKGFATTTPQTISVSVLGRDGCTYYDTITVETYTNTINGIIDFASAPCAADVQITYQELSDSEITGYQWQGSALDTNSISVSTSGFYTVTVTDINGCTSVATTDQISVNESFNGEILVPLQSCGFTNALITTFPDYEYTWYANDQVVEFGSTVGLFTAGTIDIKVVSTQISTGEVCDSLQTQIVISPNPFLPFIESKISLCQPFIAELHVINYDSVRWTSDFLEVTAGTIHTSQSGTYKATATNEFGCQSSFSVTVSDPTPDFAHLEDLCIQDCREQLDSLAITVPASTEVYDQWTYYSVDSMGQIATVQTGTGISPQIRITSAMYGYLRLEVSIDACSYIASDLPLDLFSCFVEELPVVCDTIDSFNSNCGLTVYECLVDAEHGGPILYYEGSITIDSTMTLCNDQLISSFSNGSITIIDHHTHELANGQTQVDYTANITVNDALLFEQESGYIQFEFCNATDDAAQCIAYLLPYRSCGNGYDCRVSYSGLSAGDGGIIATFCLNLPGASVDDCTVREFEITAEISGQTSTEEIYRMTMPTNAQPIDCIDIYISQTDFLSGDYDCIELLIVGDCAGISCSSYQCGIFGSQSRSSVTKFTSHKVNVYPNPATNKVTVNIEDALTANTSIIITDMMGSIVHTSTATGVDSMIDISSLPSGVLYLSVISDGQRISSKKIIHITSRK